MNLSSLRELIPMSSSGELEEYAPLSASDLISILDNVRARSEEIREKVRKTVTTYNKEFLRIITHSNQTAANVENLSEQLKNVLELLGEQEDPKDGRGVPLRGVNGARKSGLSDKSNADCCRGNDALIEGRNLVDVETCRLADEVQCLRNKINEHEGALVVVETIATLHNLLLATEKKFVPRDVIDAAKGMVVLQEKLGLQDRNEDLVSHKQNDLKAFRFLQDAWSDRYNKLFRLLEDLYSQAIVVDDRRFELVVTPYMTLEMGEFGAETGAVELLSIFTAMDVLGVLDIRLARLADAVFKYILTPLLMHSQTVISTLVLASGAGLKRSVLKWSFGTQHAEAVPEVLYPKIVQVIKFLNDHVFGNDKIQMGQFGRLVWPRLAEAIISGCLSKAVPSKTSQLKDFESIAELTVCFEKDLAREGLIANFDLAKGDKLSTFTKDVEVHFAWKKRRHILSKARALIVQTDYSLSKSTRRMIDDDSSEAGIGKPLHMLPDPGAISVLAESLLRIVHDAIEGACLSTPTTALEFYHASRDALLLFRAIIPLKVVAQPKVIQVAALCHNDCLYIAQEILTFVFQYREDLPPCLKSVFTFVDLVPIFRQLALEVLHRQIEVIQAEILENLDHANGFENTIDQTEFQLAEAALEKVFEAFSSLGDQLKPVLAHSVYKKVIGELINLVIERIIYEVLSIRDIQVEETLKLQKLLLIVQERFPPILAGLIEISEREMAKEEAVDKSVPLWCKLVSLTKLMEMSLVSINQAWESGDLSACGFTPCEVMKLIRAVFSETPLREECLQRIGSSS